MDDVEGLDDRVFVVHVAFDDLDDADVEQFRRQAAGLAARYEGTGRLTEDLLYLLAVAATDDLKDRAAKGEAVDHGLMVVVDSTSPSEQTKDDLGTLLARIWELIGREDTRPKVRGVWHKVAESVKENRARLQAIGLSL